MGVGGAVALNLLDGAAAWVQLAVAVPLCAALFAGVSGLLKNDEMRVLFGGKQAG